MLTKLAVEPPGTVSILRQDIQKSYEQAIAQKDIKQVSECMLEWFPQYVH